jgi:hypothetical protein
MGNEYRQNYKNLVGRPNIIGRDVWEVTGSVGLAIAAGVPLTDSLGGGSYVAGADARLDGVMIQATGVLGLGRIGVDVKLDGLTVASGHLYAGGPAAQYIPLSVSSLEDVPVASGQTLTANVSVEQGLDAGQAVRAALSITLLEYPERA